MTELELLSANSVPYASLSGQLLKVVKRFQKVRLVYKPY